MKIKTVLIDRDEEFLLSLKELLAQFPEIELSAVIAEPEMAGALLSRINPDLIFTDVKLSGIVSAFYPRGETHCIQVLCVTDEKDLICALHQSVFDFLLKPLQMNDIQEVIDRYRKRIKVLHPEPFRISIPSPADIVSLPTLTGLQFINVRDIVLFNCVKELAGGKSQWYVLLADFHKLKLRKNLTAREIGGYMGENRFAQINQSVFVNLVYIERIEYKTHHCKLVSPFDEIELTISRTHLFGFRERFDVL